MRRGRVNNNPRINTKYIRIAAILREEIEGGTFQAGVDFPLLKELSERFGVDSNTVSHSVRILKNEGLVARKKRHGLQEKGRGQYFIPSSENLQGGSAEKRQ